jgi:DNA-binding MurR/RpiR family transcriptional regulator
MKGANVTTSRVAYLRHTIDLQNQAAQHGLTGLAITAPHEYITARMERIALMVQAHKEQVGEEQAIREAAQALEALCDALAKEIPERHEKTPVPVSTTERQPG